MDGLGLPPWHWISASRRVWRVARTFVYNDGMRQQGGAGDSRGAEAKAPQGTVAEECTS